MACPGFLLTFTSIWLSSVEIKQDVITAAVESVVHQRESLPYETTILSQSIVTPHLWERCSHKRKLGRVRNEML